MKHDGAELRLLSQLLDDCAELSGPAQEAWLAGLTGEAARLRPALSRMLALQASSALDGFLERPPEVAAPAAQAAASDFSPDDHIGPYRLLRVIGRGGMGEVWLATRADGQLKRSVALKLPVLSVRRSVLVQRFERERDILSALSHPHIARLYDAGVADDGQPYMALEYVEGTPITEAADERALDAPARVRLLRQVMDAVQYAHANLVIHRDLKPGNVLVTAEGTAKLLDFGIAKLVEDEAVASADSELTRLGGRALTLRYAAPEMIGGGVVSTAVDVWALGVLLHELLTGRRPFDGGANGSVEQQILALDPARPSQSRSGAVAKLSRSLAGDIDTIVLKALRKGPAERYATVGAFADDLDRWLRGEPVLAQRDGGWYRTRKFVGRHKLAVFGASLAGVALIATASVAVLLGLQAREESARAVAARDFMVNIFRQSDPDMSQGREVSAKQLLTQGFKTVLNTMQGQPLLQAELLHSIGLTLESMYDLPAADAGYAEAALRYQRLGRLREAAALTVDRAALRLGSMWEVPAATRLLAQAEAAYPRHADDPEFMARHAAYLSFAAHLAADKQARQTWYERARLHAGLGFRDASPRTVQAVRMLAIVEGAVGQAERASQRLGALLDQLQADPDSLPSNQMSVLIEIASAERLAGRYQSALARYEAAEALCQGSLDAKGNQCIYLQFHRAGLMLLLGFDQQAMATVPLLEPPRGPVETVWERHRIIRVFEVLDRNGRLGERPDLVARVIALGDAAAPTEEDRAPQLLALVAQVRHLLREGQTASAQRVSSRAQAMIAARGLEGIGVVVQVMALRATGLHALGEHQRALELLDRACAVQAQGLGSENPATQLVCIARARPLWALQRQAEALALLDHALPILRQAMGSKAPTLLKIVALRGELASAAPGAMPDVQKVEIFL